MKLERQQVLHIAKLARVELSETEVETYSEQLYLIGARLAFYGGP